MKLYLESGDYIVELTDYDGSSITNMRVAEASAPNTWYTFSSVALETPNPSYDGAYIGTHDHKFVGFGANEAAWAGNNFICFAPTELAAGQSITTDSLLLPSDWSYLIDQTGFVATDVKSELVYGQIAQYDLDSNADDSVGSFNGTANNITFGTASGRSYAELSGTNSEILLDQSVGDLWASDASWSMWFKTSATAGANDDFLYMARESYSGSSQSYFTVTLKTAGHIVAGLRSKSGSWATNPTWAETVVNDDQWHMVTFVREGTSLHLYIDGSLEGSLTNISGNFMSNVPVRIGSYSSGSGSPSRWFDGQIDDMRMWNRALDASQVSDLYIATTVSDSEAPVITLIGNAAMVVEPGDAFADPGATAIDNFDGSVSVVASGGENISISDDWVQVPAYPTMPIINGDGSLSFFHSTHVMARKENDVSAGDFEIVVEFDNNNTGSGDFGMSLIDGSNVVVFRQQAYNAWGANNSFFFGLWNGSSYLSSGAGPAQLASGAMKIAREGTIYKFYSSSDKTNFTEMGQFDASALGWTPGDMELRVSAGSRSSVDVTGFSRSDVSEGAQEGSYTITYTAQDAAGNVATAQRSVEVRDFTLADGLVAKWLFDGDLQDETGNHNALSPTGAETYVANGGNEWFDHPGNGTDYVSVPYSEDLVPTDAITVSTWIKYRDSLGNHYDNFIMANGTNADPYGSQLSWLIGRIRQDEGPLAHLAPMDNSGKFYFQIQTENGYTAAVDHQGDENSPATIETERWYHIVGTYDGSMVRIYTDGVLTGQYAQTGQIVRHPGQPITMNYHVIPELTAPGNAPGQAALSQDDTRIWNRALAAGEITSLYNETNLYSNEGETPQGENTMDAIYIKIAGSLADGFPTEPKMRLFDASGTEVTTGEVGFLGAEDDELVFILPPSNMSPGDVFAGYFAELYDGYGDGFMKTPVGAMTYEIGYYVASTNTYTSVATTAVPANEQAAMETDAFRNRDHVVLEFSWDYNGGSPTASFASTQLFTGPWPTGVVSVPVSPMKIRSNEQINHGFVNGGTFYPNVDAMAAVGVYNLGAITENASIGSLQAWSVGHAVSVYSANRTSDMLVNMKTLASVEDSASVTISALEANVIFSDSMLDSGLRAEYLAGDSVLKSDLDAQVLLEQTVRSIADSNLAVDLADAVNTLNTAISDEATERAEQDSVLKSDLDAQILAEDNARSLEDSLIRSTMAAEDTAIRSEFSIADAGLDAYIGSEISFVRSELAAEDTAMRSALDAEDSQIRVDFAAADFLLNQSINSKDSIMRVDFAAADSVLKSDLDAQILAVETDVDSEHSLIRSELSAEIDGLVDGAPALLDTLNEIAAAINDDANFATTMTTALTNATSDRAAIRSEFADADSELKSDLEAQLGVEEQARIDGDSVVKSDLEAQIAATGSGSTSGISALRADMESEDSQIRVDFAAADSVVKSELSSHLDDEAGSRATEDSQIRVDFAAADSVVKSDLDAQMAQEVADRSNADNAATADRANIRSEFAAADSVLKSELEDTLYTEVDDLSYMDSEIQADLNDEVSARIAGDSQIRVDFAAADSVLKSDLDASIVTASNAYIAADSVLKSDLEAQVGVEAQARIDGDSVVKSDLEAQLALVQADVDQNEADADLALANAANDRSVMRADFEAADSVLKSDLDAQILAVETDVDNEHSLIRSELAAEIDGLVDGAPALLDTLNEIAAAINDDANFATTMTTALTNATNDRAAIRSEFAAADDGLASDISAVAADMIAGDSGLTADLAQEALDRIAGDSVLKSDLDASLATASSAYIAADSVLKSDLEAQVTDLEGRAQADFAQMYDFCRKDGDTLVATLVAGTMFPLSQDASYIKFVTLNGLVISAAEYTEVPNLGGTAIAGITFAYDLSAGDTFVVHYNKVVSFSV